tara:strand:+ start:270 stop:509 length:240 start_codon:yes stop_codon:yes gene_type:complete
MTEFKKLNEAILNLGKNWEIKNMDEKIQNQNRSNLLRELGDIKFKLHFLHNDIRYKHNKKEIVDQLEELCDMITKKRFG